MKSSIPPDHDVFLPVGEEVREEGPEFRTFPLVKGREACDSEKVGIPGILEVLKKCPFHLRIGAQPEEQPGGVPARRRLPPLEGLHPFFPVRDLRPHVGG
jgi:hypothetical protein